VAVWNALLDALMALLAAIHDALEPTILGAHAWGWAIIGLTLIVRVALLPLAAKQFKSMRGMQELQPEMQRIKKKYKVDRDLMKKDPEKYKAQRQKMNEETMALYKEHGVNPAAGCLPLILQAPIFLAIFRILWDPDRVINGHHIGEATFYVFSPLGELARASVWGWILVVLMAGSMFVAQKQMMARNPSASEGLMAQQQKIMLYGMPLFLGVFGMNFPKGVLVYWVTTNLWQMAQQALILRTVKSEAASKEQAEEEARRDRTKGGGKPEILDKPRDSAARRRKGDGQRKPASSGQAKDGHKKDAQKSDGQKKDGQKKDGQKKDGQKKDGQKKKPSQPAASDHLPRRRRGKGR
jgi:YidC/Oxa1 family membrane protein insertase